MTMNTKQLGLLAGLTWILAGNALADQTIEKSFEVAPGALFQLDTDVGAVNVKTHDLSKVDIRVEIEGFDDDEFKVVFKNDGNGVVVSGEKQSRFSSWGSHKVRFEVLVPRQFNLDLKTRGGSIEVDDLQGDIVANTSGGSLHFGKITGNLQGRTSGGSINVMGVQGQVDVGTSGGSLSLGQIQGELHARTSGGSIRLDDIKGPANVATSGGSIRIENAYDKVQAKTSGGSIEVTFNQQPNGDSELATSGGSVTAYLANSVAVNLYARGNKVYSDFEVNGETSAKSKLKGAINGGGPELELQTSAGNVYIKRK